MSFRILIPFFLISLNLGQVFGQGTIRNYLISFTDKNNSPYTISKPNEFLSQRAIDKRTRFNIPITEEDLPVNPQYISAIQNNGYKVILSTKWFNAVVIETMDSLAPLTLSALPFVKDTLRLRKKYEWDTLIFRKQIDRKTTNLTVSPLLKDYGYAASQINLLKGQTLHQLGYQGEGMLIAQLDAGYFKVNELEVFQKLRDQNRLLATKDFVNTNRDFFLKGGTHGAIVLSCMAADKKGFFVGTSPNASYILMNTENDSSEYPTEEISWIAGAEYADSFGADIINSSLGYSVFDSSALDHTYQKMDGKTLLISQAASKLASKGIILVNSAGNSGNNSWFYITAPADAKDILTIGATDTQGIITRFSSRGPTYDGRIKPDVCAPGYHTFVADAGRSGVALVAGTSVAAPILTGLTACLWQAFPDKTALEIIQAIKNSANRFFNPDPDYGYGVANFFSAYYNLKRDKVSYDSVPSNNRLKVNLFPNPTNGLLNVMIETERSFSPITMNIFSLASGKQIASKTINYNKTLNSFQESLALENFSDGVYFIDIEGNKYKFVKVSSSTY